MPEAPVPAVEPKADAKVVETAAAPAPTAEEVQAAAQRLADQKAAIEKARAQAAIDRQYLEAAKKGNLAELKDWLGKGASLQANDDGNTALFYAAQFGRMDTVLFLLQRGIPVDVKNRIGSTPLMAAAGGGHKEVARLLYDLGSDPVLNNFTGSSAYSYARSAGYADMVEMLRQPRNVDDVSFTRAVGDLTLQEVFNFAHADRLTILRRGADGPVESLQRDSFSDLSDKAALRRAFDAYAKKGGKRPEGDFFEVEAKITVEPEPPEKKSGKKPWRPWRRE